ncbi:CvpA family protein [Chromohalobacter canadensis]|uniref:CvpA family protein n=1 Tax=Chromohalobacter canadensis TaxID=141389 RepID=A0ABZ0YAU2_9GAMM|nr:CvpA family protein [Chromohalobacter canadensis]MCK0768015.1 CvpA family protein [Chromohalobacter canadensis]MCT8467721.1 CvpA family protein [Chromohalobacter canadensis]MCT8470531.1 CvpA family protein [Chromohalobacter canadensis]MCT8498218.1 CvpA family protein [Chromohalobacter canadensis]WQH08582.1 CvpA family protein [Chromohalobacter canadensis]
MTLTWLDWAFLAVLAVSMLAGFMRGLVREALGLAAWVAALLGARMFAPAVAEMMAPYIDHPEIRLVLGFVLVIFVIIMLCGFLIRMINAAIEWVGMGFFNRVAGATFGAARGALILVLATVILTLTPLSGIAAWQNAQLRPAFEQLRDWSVDRLEKWEIDTSGAERALRDTGREAADQVLETSPEAPAPNASSDKTAP